MTPEESASLRDHLEIPEELQVTSEAELIRRLEELQRFQKIGKMLWDRPKRGHDVFTQPRRARAFHGFASDAPPSLEGQKLISTMMNLMIKEKRAYTVVPRESLSMKEKLRLLKDSLKKGEQWEFGQVLALGEKGPGRVANIIVTFVTLLELTRLGKISLFQREGEGGLYINVIKSLKDFNLDQIEEEHGR